MNLKELTENLLKEEEALRQGGGVSGQERQKKLGRLTARERLSLLLDDPKDTFECGLFAAYGMYSEWGSMPAAGVITIIGKVSGRTCMIIVNDATVKAGAFFPQSVKKVLRAQRIAFENRLPILYLVDSSGVFLPMQDEIFPDEDDFGRIFRNNAVLSSEGIPQFAAIMGNCIAGGGYLPVLCDQLLMTEGSGLYLAGPALVKAAIGQVVEPEALGGAKMHAEISGTVDFLAKDDKECLKKLRSLVEMLPEDPLWHYEGRKPKLKSDTLLSLVSVDGRHEYDGHDLLNAIFDEGSLLEYKEEYGKTILCTYAKLNGLPVGVVSNQRKPITSGKGEIEIGGVLYSDSADKAARFILECNQMKIPLIFLQDVMGFMVGKDAEASGIIRSGAKLVNAISNSIVPKITCIVGNSFGAGHYALCGKAYDPRFIIAWPNARYAVMGAEQARSTLESVQSKKGKEDLEVLHRMEEAYVKQMDIRYAAARGWVDAIIPPNQTREVLMKLLEYAHRVPEIKNSFSTGVIQT